MTQESEPPYRPYIPGPVYGQEPGESAAPYSYGPPYGSPMHPNGQASGQASGLYVAAAVINWVVLGILVMATCGFGIIAAAWFVPMTINIHKGARDGRKHTALGVCTLLFCNLLSGIFILVEDGNRRQF